MPPLFSIPKASIDGLAEDDSEFLAPALRLVRYLSISQSRPERLDFPDRLALILRFLIDLQPHFS